MALYALPRRGRQCILISTRRIRPPLNGRSVDHGPLILVSEVDAPASGNASDYVYDAHQKHGAGTPFDVARDCRCFFRAVLQYTCKDPLLLPGKVCANRLVTSSQGRFCSSLSSTNKRLSSTENGKPFLVGGCCPSTRPALGLGWS